MMHPPAIVHLLFELLLLGLAAGVALLLGRRGSFGQARYLLVLGGAATLFLGTVADVAVRLAGPRAEAAAGDRLLAATIWQGMGVALLVVGVGIYGWQRWRGGLDVAAGHGARCGRRIATCSACREGAGAHLCARYPGPMILGATEGFGRLARRAPADLTGLLLETVLDLPDAASDTADDAGEAAPQSTSDIRHLSSDLRHSTQAAVRLPDGSRLPVLATVEADAGGGHQVLSISVADAAPLLAAEGRARDAEALQAGLADLTPLALVVVARDGTIRQANTAATHLFGLPRQSLVGRPLTGVIEGTAAEPVDVERFLGRAWQDQTASLSLLIRQHAHRGQPAELDARAFWELPEPVLLIFGRNLAYERRLEQQLAGTHRLSVLGKLADGMAHDVNNILATILGRSQLLQRTSLFEDAAESLGLIERAAVDGAHIVRRTLDLARGRRREEVEVVNLNAVASDALAMCQSRMKLAGAPIRADLRLAQTATVLGDASELRELLVNLILNAVEAMPHGGTLRVSTQRHAESVHASVADTGQGMDAAVQARMFEPFFTTKGNRGTGLGLTLVRQIATRHRAELEVDSAPGKGTTIRLRFPPADQAPGPRAEGPGKAGTHTPALAARKPMPGRAAPATQAVPRRAGRVLVVDDDPALQRLAQDILRRAGHEVRATGSARQALTACTRRELDCLLIDLEMPEMDGWQLAAQARQLDPAVALIMVSGWGDEPPERPGQTAFDLSLAKPFEMDQLLAVVNEAIGITAERRAEVLGAQRATVGKA